MSANNGFDVDEGILSKEDVKFIDRSGKQIKGELVITNRRIVFMKKGQILHAHLLETVSGANAKSAGQIGSYFSIDVETPDGRITSRYKGSVVQANRILGFVESVTASGGTIPQIALGSMPMSSPRVPVKSSFDSLCQGGLCCLWFFVGLVFRIMLMGATIVPGAELIPGGFILLTIGLTYWWVVIKGKKAWLCYGTQCGSDKAKTVHVGQRSGHTTPPVTQDIAPIYFKEREMTGLLKCPKCLAEFSYRKEDKTQNTFSCQNCFQEFIVE